MYTLGVRQEHLIFYVNIKIKILETSDVIWTITTSIYSDGIKDFEQNLHCIQLFT